MITKPSITFIAGLLSAPLAWCDGPSPADTVYSEVSVLRDRHEPVIWGRGAASPEQLRAILLDLDAGLAQLDQPINRALGDGNPALRYRRFNFLFDKAKVLARLGDVPAGIAALDQMAEMNWWDPRAIPGPDDADLRLLLADPRAAALTARYQAGKRAVGGAASPYAEQLSAADRIAGLARVWSEARRGFVWFDHVPALDWDAAFTAAIPRVLQATDTPAYYRELMRFVVLLGDGHSNVYPPQELAKRLYARPGLRTARIEARVLVTLVSDAALAAQGVAVGDELLEVDGLNVDEHAARHVMPYQSSSTPQDRELRSYTYGLLSGDATLPVQLIMQRADGTRYTVTAPRNGYTNRPGRSSEAFELRADGVAVLRASQFESDAAAKLLDANHAALLSAKALVLDLRGNGGGSTLNGVALLSWLQPGPIELMASRVRTDSAYDAAGKGASASIEWSPAAHETVQTAHPATFDGPVAMLIDAGTFSAAEDTAATFKWMKRGLIVGTPSGGSTGQPYFFALPGGGNARVCVKRDSYPDGSDFVGRGIQPDLLAAPTVAGVRSGSDPVLQAALTALASKLRE